MVSYAWPASNLSENVAENKPTHRAEPAKGEKFAAKWEDENEEDRSGCYPPNCSRGSVVNMALRFGHSTSFMSLKAFR